MKSVNDKGILVLKTSLRSHVKVETYLRGRQWDVQSFIDVREIITYLMDAESVPLYALVCVDHQQKQVAVLPSVLRDRFGMKLIGYFDRTPSDASLVLEKLDIHYSLPSLPSGPSVERIISRMSLDEDRQSSEQTRGQKVTANRREKDSGADDGVIAVKGGESRKTEPTLERAESAGFKSIASLSKEDEHKKVPLIFMDRARGLSIESPMRNQTAKRKSATKGQLPDDLLELFAIPPKAASAAPETKSEGKTATREMQAEAEESAPNKQRAHEPTPPTSLANGQVSRPINNTESAFDHFAPAAKKSEAASPGVIQFGVAKPRRPKHVEGKASPLENVVKESLLKCPGVSVPGGLIEGVSVAQVFCLHVASNDFTGYLLAASPLDLKQTVLKNGQEFLTEFATHFYESLGVMGMTSRYHGSFFMVGPPGIDFGNWAAEKSEFLTIANLENRSVGIAFQPHSDAVTLPKANHGFLKFDIDEFVVGGDVVSTASGELGRDKKVDFNLYLHLEANQKYFLYIREGRVLYSTQVQRLTSRGISNVYVREDNAAQFLKFRARTYLAGSLSSVPAASKKTKQR